jgi:hypothetical protein
MPPAGEVEAVDVALPAGWEGEEPSDEFITNLDDTPPEDFPPPPPPSVASVTKEGTCCFRCCCCSCESCWWGSLGLFVVEILCCCCCCCCSCCCSTMEDEVADTPGEGSSVKPPNKNPGGLIRPAMSARGSSSQTIAA